MKYVFVFIVLTFYSLNIQSQNIAFTFNKEQNNLATINAGKSPTVFEITNKIETHITKAPPTKKVLFSYKKALSSVVNLKKDSINAVNIIEKATKEASIALVEKNKIEKNISSFLISQEIFDVKKNLLKEAQQLSDKYKFTNLIYADENINSSNKTKFFILSKNKLDLKIHLKKVLSKIKSAKLAVAPIKLVDNTEINNQLRLARIKLKKTKKYEVIAGKPVVMTKNTFKIKRNIFKPENVIIGDFTNLGFYRVLKGVKGYQESDLVSISEAKQNQLTSQDFLFNYIFTVIQNLNTKTIYMVFPDFIENYSLKIK